MDGMNAVATGPENYDIITATPFAGAMGAEIGNVDLANLDDATFAEIHAAWLRHHVVVFRNQKIEPQQQIDFALRFGEIHHHPYMSGMEDYPDIFEIIKEPGDTYTFGSAGTRPDAQSAQPHDDALRARGTEQGRRHTVCQHAPRL